MADQVERLRQLAEAMTAIDDRHARSLRELLDGLAALRSPFDEHAGPVHVTSSAVVIGPRGTLLHRHKRLGLWLQPGGHIEPGETPAEAAVRETAEETGVTARHPAQGPALIHVDAHDGGRGHRHLDLRYLLLAGDQDPAPADGESQDVAWFALDEAMRIADPGLVGALRIVREHRGT